MDLDDFKAKWQKNTEYQARSKEKTREQIQAVLAEKTAGILVSGKKKREITILRVLVGILLYLFLSPFFPWLLGVDGPFFTIPIQLGRLLPIFYWIKYSSMETIIPGDNLKLTLLESIKKRRSSLKNEIYFCLVSLMGVFIAFRSASQFLGYGDFWDIFRKNVFIALFVGLSLIGYYLFHKASQYRKHMQELQQYLSEFDENVTQQGVELANRPTRQGK
jgi:hypothetical protein